MWNIYSIYSISNNITIECQSSNLFASGSRTQVVNLQCVCTPRGAVLFMLVVSLLILTVNVPVFFVAGSRFQLME